MQEIEVEEKRLCVITKTMAKKKTTKKDGVSLSDVLKEIEKEFGTGTIMTLESKPDTGIDAISTGSIGLDYAVGIGGLPRGRVVEIYGAEASGKTTLALHVIAEAQKKGGDCAFIDAEHALDPQYAKRLGVDTKKLLISQPDGGEEALNVLQRLVESGKLAVVVVDSVAALTPRSELDGEIGAMQVGAQARLMSQALRILTSAVARSNTLVIFINQTRTNIGGYGDPTTTAGGKALKFYASVRIQVARISKISKGDEVMGGRIRAKIQKNKVAAPFKNTEYDLMFNEGISRAGEIMALGEKYKLITKAGITYSYGDVKLGAGYEKARTFLKQNKGVADEIISGVIALRDVPDESEVEVTETNEE